MSVDESVVFPGPTFHVDLSALDARHPVHYVVRMLIFRCSSAARRDVQLAAIKAGAQALVSRCPILGGIVVPLPPHEASDGKEDWRTIVPDRGIELVVRDLRTALPSFEELEATEFSAHRLHYDQLAPVPQDGGNDGPFAACKLQFSSINGGTILTIATSHCVADGSGTNELMRIMAEETRLAQEHLKREGVANEVSSTPATTETVGLDRGVVRNIKSELPFDIDQHPAYRRKTTHPPPPATRPHPFAATSPEIAVLLRIPAAGLAQLKADATLPDGQPAISTHDALSALLWRSVLLIRSGRSAVSQDLLASTTGSIFMPSDARRHLNIPLSYVGNVVYQLTAALSLDTLLSPSGLQHGASAVRHAITAVNPALVSSYMAKLKEEWQEWEFLTAPDTTGVPMGTDWTSGPLYSAYWGEAFGHVVRFRYPGGPGEAFNCIMPKLPDGAAELLVAVMPEEVDILKGSECFGKYLETR